MKSVLIAFAIWYLAMLLLSLWTGHTNNPMIKKWMSRTLMAMFFIPFFSFVWLPIVDELLKGNPVVILILTCATLFLLNEYFVRNARRR